MQAQTGYVELFRGNRDFRNLFAARLVSNFGDWFNLLAILAMLREFGGISASSFAGVLILKTLPVIVAAPVAGVFADRFDRRLLLIVSDLARLFVVLGMLALVLFPSVGVLYGLVIAQTIAGAFFEPARRALLPEIVRPEELTAANAVGAAMWSTMLALGSGAGGVFTSWLGWEAALVVDAASYVISILFLLFVHAPPRPARHAPVGLLQLLGVADVAEGLGWLARNPRPASLALVKAGWSLAGATTLVYTVVGERLFPVGEDALLGVTVLYVARGVGTGLGPILARWVSRSEPRRMEIAIGIAFAGGGSFLTLLAASPNLGLAACLVALAHLGGATCWVFSTIRLQQTVPDTVRGRVFATEDACFMTVSALSSAVFATAIDSGAPLRLVIVGLGLVLFVPAVAWAVRGLVYGYTAPASAADSGGEGPASSA